MAPAHGRRLVESREQTVRSAIRSGTGSASGGACSPRAGAGPPHEVVAAVVAAASDEEAQAAVVALLDLDEPVYAMAVLDLQLRRLTMPERDRAQAEHDELRAALDDRP